jgi:peptide chain release factor
LETIWLSISAGTGPEECAYAAALTLKTLTEELPNNARLSVLQTEPADRPGNIRSALIRLDGKDIAGFAQSWTGIIQWVWTSKYRPRHKRKNWFVAVQPCPENPAESPLSPADVRFSAAKASGPGGQYVNKTESAVRAVHIPTGKTVLAREERSQFSNKKRALARLAALCGQDHANRQNLAQAQRRHLHYELHRGDPIRIYEKRDDGTIAERRKP